MRFVNQAAFIDPKSRQAAMGVDFRIKNAVVDPHGKVLFYAQTGGILNPKRFELTPGAFVYRFGSVSAGPQKVAKGGWWMERAQFDKLVNFANVWSITVGMAMRTLCLVPPEWSDATLLVRGRVSDPLLAWRGLANAVVTPASDRGPLVKMPNSKRNQRPSPPSALHSRRRRSRDLGPGNSGRTGISAGQGRKRERVPLSLKLAAARRATRASPAS